MCFVEGPRAGRARQPEGPRDVRGGEPDQLLGEGDPPVLLVYGAPDTPITDATGTNAGIHHPRFGVLLEKKMKELGLECTVIAGTGRRGSDDEVLEFFARHLLGKE